MEFDITLPIAGISSNVFFLIGIGLLGGLITGLLGLGGGTTITPMLMVIGVHPIIAVTCQVNSAIGITLTGFLNYWRQNDVDLKLGFLALGGGVFGVFLGVKFSMWLESMGLILNVMSIGYIIVLTSMGFLLLKQSLKTIKNQGSTKKLHQSPGWAQKMPFVIYFSRTRVRMSAIVPFMVGMMNAIFTAILGIGNGVFMLPVLGYLIGRTSPVIYGTTQLASVVMFIFTTMFMAIESASVDLILVFFLLIGGTIGTQIGVKLSYYFYRPYLGVMGAILLFTIALKFILGLFFNIWKFSPKSQIHEINTDGVFEQIIIFSHLYPKLCGIIGVLLAVIVSLSAEGIIRCITNIFSSSQTSDNQ